MFDYFKFKRYYELLDDNKRLEKENDILKERMNNLSTQSSKEYEEAGFSIHWDRIKAVSIERNIDESNLIHTIIGIVKPDGDIGEWYLYCPHSTHQALVREFDEWKNKNAS